MIGYESLIFLLVGFASGILTGLTGGSAAMISAPILILFLGYEPFFAIGITFLINFFSSITAFFTYYKNGYYKIVEALPIFIPALFGVLIGSEISADIENTVLSNLIGSIVLVAGIFFIFKKSNSNNFNKKINIKAKNKNYFEKKSFKTFILILLGLILGIFTGISGFSGGIGFLLILTLFFKYEIHTSIGTSIFIMLFVDLIGAFGHLKESYTSLSPIFLLAPLGAIIGANISSRISISFTEKQLNRIIGIILSILGILLIIKKFVIIS